MRRRALLTALAASAALTLSGLLGTHGRASAPTAVTECQGDACAAVALTFDEAKQQYRVQNNSTDRWVKVEASNLAASAPACAAPGKTVPLPLKSIVGSYRAAYDQAGCGATGAE